MAQHLQRLVRPFFSLETLVLHFEVVLEMVEEDLFPHLIKM